MDIKVFKEKIFTRALEQGFSDCEIYYVNSKSLQVNVYNKEISQYKNAQMSGVSFRGHINGNIGYSYSEKLDEEALDFLIKEAAENARINESENQRINDDSKVLSFKNNIVCENTPDELIQLALEMEDAAYKADKRVKNIIQCAAGLADGYVYIANSYGMELYQENSYCIAVLYVSVAEGDQVKIAGEVFYDKNYDGFSPEKMAEKAVKKGLGMLGAKQAKSTTATILLKNEAAVDLISTYLGNFFAENVQKGFSLLKDKTGEKIANEKITLRDAAKHPLALEELNFDSEGIMVKDKNIIENGILKTYLYNIKSADKEGVESTGNGFKGGFKSTVSTSCANIYVEPGEKDFDSLAASLESGFVITDLSGLHSGTNQISGDFSLLAEGFYVEGGKVQHPVEQITIAGNFYDVLMNIVEVGSDLRFDLPGAGGSVGMPSLVIKNVNISGE